MKSIFYVGEKVVAVKDHSGGLFKKGQIFEILDIKEGCCEFLVKINNDHFFGRMQCLCGKLHRLGARYFSENCFAPIQEIGNMTFEEAISIVTTNEIVKH